MHIWRLDKWKTVLPENLNRRTGIRFRLDKSIDIEVKQAIIRFAKWLRSEYYFPLRVNVYVKNTKTLRSKDGEKVVGVFFEPFSYLEEPYIKIAVGDYTELKIQDGRDNALASLLLSVSHETTHYFQWINNIKLTPKGLERQATNYSNYIVDEYSTTCTHP